MPGIVDTPLKIRETEQRITYLRKRAKMMLTLWFNYSKEIEKLNTELNMLKQNPTHENKASP